jgi:DNA invertase Pin-like site-specific DNA recombinase
LARIERGDATALVVYRLDRLARNLIPQETIHVRLEASGSGVLSITEPAVEGDDATRTVIRQVLEVFAQYERAVIRGRMMAGKAAKIAKGGYGGSLPAYDCKAAGGALVVNEDESAVIDTVTTMRRSSQSHRAIASALSVPRITTRTGGAWNPNQIRRIAQRAGVAKGRVIPSLPEDPSSPQHTVPVDPKCVPTCRVRRRPEGVRE